MSKKRKIQFIILVALMILLIIFLIYTLAKSIYEYTDRAKSSHKLVATFNEIYEKDGMEVILFASPSCKWCKKFVPILDEIAKENDFEYNYLDVTQLFQEDLEKIYEKLDIKYGGIPHLVVVENKKVLVDKIGAQEKDEAIEFLRKTGLIKGDVEDGESISIGS